MEGDGKGDGSLRRVLLLRPADASGSSRMNGEAARALLASVRTHAHGQLRLPPT